MSYWEDRQEAMYLAGEMQAQEYFKRLEKAFKQARKELLGVVNDFCLRYADENGVSYTQAQRMLKKAEAGDLQDFIARVYSSMGKYSLEVNNMSIRARITRYQALQLQVEAVLQKLYAVDFEALGKETMRDIYKESYYRTWYNIDVYKGFHSAFSQINPHTIDALIKLPFDGANFSDRIWKQKNHLETQLMEALTTMMVQGKNPQTLTKEFAKKMKSKQSDAYRLLQSESSFLINQAAHDAYKEDGVETYRMLATLDSKTCGICGRLDGRVFPVAEAVVGVNMAPVHNYCRCTDVPDYGDGDMKDTTRAARDPETGKTYEVPADMTYEEWVEKYLKNQENQEKSPEYLIRAHKGVKDISAEKEAVEQSLSKMPEKVQAAIEDGTIIDIGKSGASQYDYNHDILYVAKGSGKTAVIHEIGHLAENKIIDNTKVQSLIGELTGEVDITQIQSEVFFDSGNNPHEIFLINNPAFVSEYQGRVYCDTVWDAFDESGNFRSDLLWEFTSEGFREYIENPENLKSVNPKLYKLLEEALND